MRGYGVESEERGPGAPAVRCLRGLIGLLLLSSASLLELICIFSVVTAAIVRASKEAQGLQAI
jgi:hypothetical protein